MIAWSDVISALALMLVFEGIMPFISPGSWRRTMLQAGKLEDKTLRVIGFASMLAGVVFLYLTR
ncbi:hypothetical protein MNBD_GAMMA10-1569 [hydrothermal vent metagenome]|uniref:Inner membrane protein YjeT (Clustered with HflC) n=1 Tax=hydrothermal vent metagenome TaxID=652676 RepID=A0A3B0XUP8_9ZZZZ